MKTIQIKYRTITSVFCELIEYAKNCNKKIIYISSIEMLKYIIIDFTLKYGFKNLMFDYLDTFENILIINQNNYLRKKTI